MGRTERNGHEGSPRLAGRYRLVEKLGAGGMSVVWRGYDEILGREVAVKVLSPQLAEDRAFRDRLRQEALAAARLCHPHITGIFDFGEAPISEHLTVPYVVMELNDGESVGARIGRQGSLEWREAVMITAEVASALATAHARGLVHRDVTPANVMLTGAGAKVVDFGISAVVGQRDAAPDGSLLGTPAYLAPERLGGASVSPATDVYALGLLLYRALTGRLPWPAENTAEALRAHLYADPEPIPELAGMPAGVAELCLRCLAKAPEGRPGAAEVARSLAATVGLRAVIPPLREGERSSAPAARAVVPVGAVPGQGPHTAPDGVSCPESDSRARDPRARDSRARDSRARDPRAGDPRAGDPHASDPCAETGPRVAVGGGSPARSGGGSSAAPGRGPLVTAGGWRAAMAKYRLRAGLRLGVWFRLGAVQPLGGGLFTGGPRGGPFASLFSWRGPGDLSRRRDRLPAVAALATVVLLAATVLSWSARREAHDATDGTHTTAAGADGPAVGAPAAGGPKRGRCVIRYEVQRDSGTDFEARMTVYATAAQQSDWRVEFSYPGAQRLTPASRAVTQQGRRVVVTGKGRSRVVTLHGGYRDRNPLPLAFALNGQNCRAEVLGSISAGAVNNNSVSAAVEQAPRNSGTLNKRKRTQPKRPGTTKKHVEEVPTGRSATPAPKHSTGFSLA